MKTTFWVLAVLIPTFVAGAAFSATIATNESFTLSLSYQGTFNGIFDVPLPNGQVTIDEAPMDVFHIELTNNLSANE
ncbi:MAG: hypothetical protein AAF823_10345 [Planctomycetota bacterium]